MIVHVLCLEKRLSLTAFDAIVLESYCDDIHTGLVSATLEAELISGIHCFKNRKE